MDASNIGRILYDEWDPIEVKGLAPEDEYASYAKEIARILDHGGDREEVERFLDQVRTLEMRLKSDHQEDARVMDLIEACRDDLMGAPPAPRLGV